MSVRIHAIAKEIKKTSKEVLEILAERGYELKSASSTIDNITAESLIDEFKSAIEEKVAETQVAEKINLQLKSKQVKHHHPLRYRLLRVRRI